MREQHGTFGVPIPSPCDGAALSLHAPGQVLPWHRHANAYVCVVLAGAFLESAGSQEGHRRVGDIVFHPAGERHADRFGPAGGRCLNLRIPGATISRTEVRRADAAFRAAAESLTVQSALGAAADPLAAESAFAEIEGALLDPGPLPRDMPIERVIEALDETPQHDWSLTELAALAGRHPTHLARAFREKTGLSIGAYRRRRKLASLALALRCTDELLGTLAHAHGYADQAHMSREFRRAAGCAPGEWRRRFR